MPPLHSGPAVRPASLSAIVICACGFVPPPDGPRMIVTDPLNTLSKTHVLLPVELVVVWERDHGLENVPV